MSTTTTEAEVAHVRSFNRVVTQRIGALNDRYLGSGRPLGQDRMLWEIGVTGWEVRSLRARLGLDAGHASRLLRALEAAGLATVEPSPADRRVRVASLTRRGRSELEALSRRSDELAASLLDPLEPDDRNELITAMRTVKRLLTVSEIDIRQVDPAEPDAQRCIAAYVAELNRR
ncbi:MAG: MarR family transcriptional regulator, partial [Pseudonocardia sp.]|nr:MarR family transcriptional regulator [Pseudonocardia sp.]